MIRRFKPLAVIAALLLAGCATAPRTERVRLPDAADDTLLPAGLAIGQIVLPEYIDQSRIVLELDDGVLYRAQYHLWNEALENGIRRIIEPQLANRPPEAEQFLDLAISTFHGSRSGVVRLEGSWSVRGAGSTETLHSDRFQIEAPLSADGYPALAAAHTAAIEELARMIAQRLSEPR